jgi:hypothetical protein
VPMKRPGQRQETADLASDRAAYISDQVISINGGMIYGSDPKAGLPREVNRPRGLCK